MPTPRIGLQLYTLRELMAQDVDCALDTVVDCGYSVVEWFGGFWQREPTSLRKALDQRGLEVVAAHIDLAELRRAAQSGSFATWLADYRQLGTHRLIVPWLPPEERTEADAYERFGRELNLLSHRLRAQRFLLGYHNHEFEFESAQVGHDHRGHPTDCGLHRLLRQSTESHFFLELDAFWVQWAGFDPAATLADLAPRVDLVHVKDGSGLSSQPPPQEPRFRAVGDGEIDLARLVAAAVEAKCEALIVEIDHLETDLTEALRQSLRNTTNALEQTLKAAS